MLPRLRQLPWLLCRLPVRLPLARVLLTFREREALCLFAACRAFLNVISTVAVSHNSQYSAAYIKHQTSNPPVDGFAVANIKSSSVTIA